MSLLDILELKKDTDAIFPPPGSVWCLLMSHSLSLFHISLHRFSSPYLSVPPLLSVPLSTPVYTDSLPLPSAETTNSPASNLVWGFRYVYTHRPKVPASKLVPANLSLLDGLPSPPVGSPSDFDILLPFEKVMH